MTKNADAIRSLYQFSEYPLDLSHPVCKEYPLLKLGVASSVQYFAAMLTPVVVEIMDANPTHTSWVLTAPPSRRIPTAAILLSLEIYERLKRNYPDLSLVQLYNNREEGSIHENARDLNTFSGYSRYTWKERKELIQRNQFVIEEDDFRNRGIVFINDINVTGASQEHISEVFSSVYPDKVNWLYIIDCDKGIGRKHPHLENELNNIDIHTVQDFAAILAKKDIQYTAKCISKLFSYEPGELEQLLVLLSPDKKLKLWDAISREDLYQGDFFKEKRQLLR